MSSDQMPAPRKIKLIKFPPPGQEKTSNARGMPGVCPGGGGRMLKLRFDWYITQVGMFDVISVQIKCLISQIIGKSTNYKLNTLDQIYNIHFQEVS